MKFKNIKSFDYAQGNTFGQGHRLMFGCRGTPEKLIEDATPAIPKIGDRLFGVAPFTMIRGAPVSKLSDEPLIAIRGAPIGYAQSTPVIYARGKPLTTSMLVISTMQKERFATTEVEFNGLLPTSGMTARGRPPAASIRGPANAGPGILIRLNSLKRQWYALKEGMKEYRSLKFDSRHPVRQLTNQGSVTVGAGMNRFFSAFGMTEMNTCMIDYAQGNTFGQEHRLMFGCRGTPEKLIEDATPAIPKIGDRLFGVAPFTMIRGAPVSKLSDEPLIAIRGAPIGYAQSTPVIYARGKPLTTSMLVISTMQKERFATTEVEFNGLLPTSGMTARGRPPAASIRGPANAGPGILIRLNSLKRQWYALKEGMKEYRSLKFDSRHPVRQLTNQGSVTVGAGMNRFFSAFGMTEVNTCMIV